MPKNSRQPLTREKSKPPRFHPGRKEHAEKYISNLEGDKDKEYATAQLTFIWSGGKAPTKPKKLSAARAREIDAALLAIFATL